VKLMTVISMMREHATVGTIGRTVIRSWSCAYEP
jgi:hypothetical protein